jgi:FKBP-type peptidyl-prolyl cis-trans isomerase SlyD
MSNKDIITENKLVELSYKVIDEKTGEVLTSVEYPIGYVHGMNSVLSSQVTAELEGKAAGDIIEVPIDGDTLYGPRDESLVITDYIENVPEEYREVGTTIVMENDKGDTKSFIVTRIDEKTLTIDGNNPLCGRSVIFRLEVLKVRDATPEEIEVGGSVVAGPDVGQAMLSIDKAKPTTTH